MAKKFISYVVSDDPNKYPDGAVHTDGYYYERVKDIVSSLGFTKYEIGSITPTADSAYLYITHSLGEIPKVVIVNSVDVTGASRVNTYAGAITNEGKHYYGVTKNSRAGGYHLFNGDGTSSVVKVDAGDSDMRYSGGKTYNYILLA